MPTDITGLQSEAAGFVLRLLWSWHRCVAQLPEFPSHSSGLGIRSIVFKARTKDNGVFPASRTTHDIRRVTKSQPRHDHVQSAGSLGTHLLKRQSSRLWWLMCISNLSASQDDRLHPRLQATTLGDNCHCSSPPLHRPPSSAHNYLPTAHTDGKHKPHDESKSPKFRLIPLFLSLLYLPNLHVVS